MPPSLIELALKFLPYVIMFVITVIAGLVAWIVPGTWPYCAAIVGLPIVIFVGIKFTKFLPYLLILVVLAGVGLFVYYEIKAKEALIATNTELSIANQTKDKTIKTMQQNFDIIKQVSDGNLKRLNDVEAKYKKLSSTLNPPINLKQAATQPKVVEQQVNKDTAKLLDDINKQTQKSLYTLPNDPVDTGKN